MRPLVGVVAALMACGRIGFDAGSGGDGGAGSGDGVDALVVPPEPFVLHFAGSGIDFIPNCIGRDEAANIYFAMSFDGTVDVSGRSFTPFGANDVLIGSLSVNGGIRWMQQLGGSGDDDVTCIATDSQANVYVVGRFAGTAYLGSMVTSRGNADAYVASFTSDGAPRFALDLGGPGLDTGSHVAIDELDRIYVTGMSSDSADLGGGIRGSAGLLDIFVASYTSDGAHRWSRTLGGAGNDQGATIVTDGVHVGVTGSFQQTAQFDGVPKTAVGADDVFMLSLDTDGTQLGVAAAGTTRVEIGYGFVTTATGYVVGGMWDAVATLYGTRSYTASSGFLGTMGFDGQGPTWTTLPSAMALQILAITRTPSGLLATGQLLGSANFGGGSISSQVSDGFFLELDSSGSFRDVTLFGGPGEQFVTDLMPESDGSLLIFAMFLGAFDIGGMQLSSAGDFDVVIARIPAP